ncbi:hypothetical protein BVX95_00845 [archaeon D22]|nr:hypothetical protein BVX95_00845 [archaeon D22]
MIIGIVILILLILLSAFFSGSESALLSLNEFKIKHMIERKEKNSILIENLKSDPHRLLTAILIANNVLNLSASALATTIALQYFGEVGPAVSTGILTFLVLVFGEISPKAIATNHPEAFAKVAARPLDTTIKLLFPLVWIFEKLTKTLVKEKDADIPKMSEEELKSIIRYGEEEGSIDTEEKEMIHNIFELDDITVEEIMTPRNEMFSIQKDTKLIDALPEIKKMMYSRIPIYDEDHDHIVGILYTKDLIKQLDKKPLNTKVLSFAKDPLFVPTTMKINKLLNLFKKEKSHMAVIIDEHGGVSGIITLEDVLEEVVGEIYDETDKIEVMIKKINQNTAIVDGSAEFEHVNQELGLKIKTTKDDDFETISGYILQRADKIPDEGETLSFKKFDAIIEKIDGQKIKQIKIIKKVK